MKQKTLQLMLAACLLIPTMAIAQDHQSWNDLVISEYRNAAGLYNSTTWAYIEFTNMGEDTLDLNKYWAVTSWGDLNTGNTGAQKATLGQYPDHKLLPGKSFVWSIAQENLSLDRYGNLSYPNGYINYEAQIKADVVAHVNTLTDGEALGRYNVLALYCRADTNLVADTIPDSAMVDKFWLNNSERPGGNSLYPIAGIVTSNPNYDRIWVRKFKIKKGNTDFNVGRGTNADDSEWMPLPRNIGPNDVLFTTFGTHMVSEELDIMPKTEDITVDESNGIITLPYDIPRDSIFRFFSYGPNHAWQFKLGSDTAKYFVSEGDSVEFYVLGNERKVFEFAFKVADQPAGFAQVEPLVYKNDYGNFTRRYSVSDGYMDMDTIGQIPFDCPTDTFIENIIVNKDASFEFIWKNGVLNSEISDGDILRVTNGSETKDYRLSVWPYRPSSLSDLSTVVFSGFELWENPYTFEMTDTMLNFGSSNYFYVVNLPEGTTTSPQLIVTPQNDNAKYYIKRAKNLNGSEAERTITIDVMAEDDSTTSSYSFLLNVERETPPVVGEPFFCDMTGSWGGNAGVSMQIYNPMNEYINISDYMIMQIPATKPDFESFINEIKTGDTDDALNKAVMRPSSYIQADAEGNPYFVDDIYVGAELEPNGVFSIGNDKSWPATQGNDPDNAKDKMDMVIGRTHLYKEGFSRTKAYWDNRFNNQFPYVESDGSTANEGWLLMNNVFFTKFDKGATYALFKITNDSVKEGTKPVYKDFFKDFEVVDVVNGLTTTGTPWVVNAIVHGEDSVIRFDASGVHHRTGLHRKQDVYTGNPIDLGSFGSEGNEGEWIWYGMEYTDDGKYNLISKTNDKGDLGGQSYGRPLLNKHVMITNAHIPYISSTVYIVSKGISEHEKIYGVLSKTDVNGFMANIIKPDAEMSVVVKSASGDVKEGADVIVNGDKVTSTASNGLSSVTYQIIEGPLSANTTLTAKNGADFSIADTSITGVTFGTTIKELMDNIEGPVTAQVVLTDGADYVVPYVAYSKDTMVLEPVDAKVSDMYVIEVTAQDGVTQAKYSISFKEESDIYVLSDVYVVNEDSKEINFVSRLNVNRLLANLMASPGATMKIVNKHHIQREIGIVQYQDKVIVTKGDQSVMYYLKFIDEEINEVPVQEVSAISAHVYPNPTEGAITIQGVAGATDLKVMNITGQALKMVKVSGESMTLRLHNKPGIYFISVLNKQRIVETHKVILK